MPLDPVTGGAIISGGASLVSSLIGSGTSKKARKHQRAMAEYAYSKDLEMWERANAYNAPAAQMERLKAAGLNPNLVYGTGSVAGQAAGKIPEYQVPDQPFVPVSLEGAGQSIMQYQDMRLREAQVSALEAQTRNADARTATEFVRKSKYLSDADKAAIEARILSELEDVEVGKGVAELDLIKQRLTNEQKKALNLDLKNEFQRYRNQWEKYGVTGRDALWIRAAVKIIQELGLDGSWLKDFQKFLPDGLPGFF